jgi:hypothetical protein
MNYKRLFTIAVLLVSISIIIVPYATVGKANATQPGQIFNPLILSMIDQVDPGDIYSLTSDLSGEDQVLISGEPYTIDTRAALSGEPNLKATQYLLEYYQGLGMQVSRQDFSYWGRILSNVVAEKTGTIFPERIFMITSHMDDVPISPRSPGADDDASGTVGVMLAAEILNQYEFGCTLRFANFNAEEYGMIGSQDYARKTYCAGEDVQGVINLDMIAWNSAGSAPEMDLHALPSVTGSDEIADLFQEVVSTYELNLIPTRAIPVTVASDHSSFWRYDYPAILVSEDINDFNPNYHTKFDLLENLPDFDYYTELVKASIGTLAHLGCLVEGGWGTISGTVSDKTTQLPIAGADVTLSNPDWGYTFITRTDQNGDYQFSAQGGWHEISADAFAYSFTPTTSIYVTQSQELQVDQELAPIEETRYYFPFMGNKFQAVIPGCP